MTKELLKKLESLVTDNYEKEEEEETFGVPVGYPKESVTFPKTWRLVGEKDNWYQSVGISVIRDTNPMQDEVLLPKGWGLSADNSYQQRSFLRDEKGRVRASIHKRLNYGGGYEGVGYVHCALNWNLVDRGITLYGQPIAKLPEWSFRPISGMRAEYSPISELWVNKWMSTHFPDWRDVTAYWEVEVEEYPDVTPFDENQWYHIGGGVPTKKISHRIKDEYGQCGFDFDDPVKVKHHRQLSGSIWSWKTNKEGTIDLFKPGKEIR